MTPQPQPQMPKPGQPRCFICSALHSAADPLRLRSLTQLTAPPATRQDAVPICDDCQPHWSFAIIAETHANLAEETGNPPPLTDRP